MLTGKQNGMGRYEFAAEKVKTPPRDNLALDAMDALRADMSYGKYKALHPNTKNANEARLAAMQDNGKRPYKPRNTYALTCSHCGRLFESPRRNTRHCSTECKREAKNRQWRQLHGKKKVEE